MKKCFGNWRVNCPQDDATCEEREECWAHPQPGEDENTQDAVIIIVETDPNRWDCFGMHLRVCIKRTCERYNECWDAMWGAQGTVIVTEEI